MKQYNDKRKEAIIVVGISFIMIAMGLKIMTLENEINYKFSYEMIDTKNLSTVKIEKKKNVKEDNNSIIYLLNSKKEVNNSIDSLEEVELPNKKVVVETNNIVKTIKKEEVKKEEIKKTTQSSPPAPLIVWRLPIERGIITQNPNYSHVAYDMTSPRGIYETIYPIADGHISGIYRDGAGALIVTVIHNVGGRSYTSQYVHLSSYAPGIHVNMKVDTNTPLGQMGSTGYSTGVHLHIALLDCGLFDPNDPNCYDINAFIRYGKIRLSQGFIGLGSVINMPAVWNTR